MATKKRKATLEDVWETINSLGVAQQMTEKAQQKTEAAQQKTEEVLQETRKAQQETEKFLEGLGKKWDEANGNFNTKWGAFIANLVSGGLIKLLGERGIKVNHVQKGVISYREDGTKEHEYDLVALNGKEAVVVEAKTTLKTHDVDVFLTKLKKFKKNLPKLSYKRVIYGAIAYLGVPDKSPESYAVKKGLFAIQSPGGKADVSVIINKKDFRPKEF